MDAWNSFHDEELTTRNQEKYVRYDFEFHKFSRPGKHISLFFFGLERSSLPVELLISGSDVSVDVVEIVCSLVKNLSPSVNGAVMVSMGVNILTKMLIW